MQTRAKQERIIEAVRLGLEGDAAVEFVCRSGHAMNTSGITRHLRAMGGRGNVRKLVAQGMTNQEILYTCFPGADLTEVAPAPPKQEELFEPTPAPSNAESAELEDTALYDTAKISLRLPADLYEAVRLAAHAENKTQSQLIIEILTAALSRMPEPPRE